MASVIDFFFRWETIIDGERKGAGNIKIPLEVAIDGQFNDLKKKLSAGPDPWDAWVAGADTLADFDFLYIESDDEVYVELVVDKDADVGTEAIAFELDPNRPFFMFTDIGLANYTIDFAAITRDVIDQIRIHNADAATTPTVRVFLAT